MQGRKTRAIGMDGEHRPKARTAASARRPVQRVVRENQSGTRISSVAVRVITVSIIGSCRETMKGRKTRAIGTDGEHRAPARAAALNGRPIQDVAR